MYSYLWTFFIYAFLGWCGEGIFAAIVDRRFVNRGFLLGPVCPIYGIGVVLIDFCLRPVGYSVPALLIGSLVLGAGLELFTGWLLEKIFRRRWWDYSHVPHNFRGYICLKFALLWAALGTVAVRGLLPWSRQLAALLPRRLGWVLLGALLALTLADLLVTVVSLISLNSKLKDPAAGTQQLSESRMYRRLLRAFPNLKVLEHNEQLDSLVENVDALRQRSSEALAENVSAFRQKSGEVMKRRDELIHQCYEQTLAEEEEAPFAFGLCWAKMFWVFMIGSFVGFVCETLYALAVPPHVLEPRVSFVFGPLISVYGLGAMAITIFLYRMYNQKDILIFLASMVLGAAFEYLCSFLQQAVFGTVSWEYSDSALNIGGRTNLMYSVFWGILGLVWIKDVYPAMSRWIQKIPKKVAHPLTALTAVLLAVDVVLTVGALFRQSQRINDIPAENAVQTFFDTAFPDEYLNFIYPHMEYLGKPAIVHEPPLPANQD